MTTQRAYLPDALADRLEVALTAGSHASAPMMAVTVPAPVTSPAHAFSLYGPQLPAYYFATGDRGGDVGLGSAATLESNASNDLLRVQSEAQHLLEHVFEIGIDSAARSPRFYGGVAYDRPSDLSGPWRSFAQIRFDLPRYRYITDGQRASLTLHLLQEDATTASNRRSWIDGLGALLAQLALNPQRQPLPKVRVYRDRPARERWLRHVELALESLQQGSLEKVVLAREVELELDAPPDVAKILENLDALSPETTRFAFRRDNSVFLGATPERLIMRLGSELRTEAVAGSIRALDTDAADQLMTNAKERHEHDLVVRELVRKFEALGAKPEVPPRPSIRQLRHVLHLATSIRARLFGPPHILTLMARLHPTPAVGGVPEAAARDFMREHEEFERGWYAAPIGWFDAQGDGEFVVGLRSGLLEGSLLRLYAGAGIVRDSQPDREWAETELKLQSLLEAIGSSNATAPADTCSRFDMPASGHRFIETP